ncbi:hypothetical protein JavanS176_0001 [Streptococcus satellite phage Javan176]|nr:hypothetical protein JavanS176_0001 [Streptococcus satellite phage Javan176]
MPQATQTNEKKVNQTTSYPAREIGTHRLKSLYGFYMSL